MRTSDGVNVWEFYGEDERRRESPEVHYGLDWRSAAEPWAVFGLHWIEDTHEIFVLRAPDPRILRSLASPFGGVPLRLGGGYLRVEVLGWADDKQVLDRALAGWQSRMSGFDSLQWVRDRLDQAAASGQGD